MSDDIYKEIVQSITEGCDGNVESDEDPCDHKGSKMEVTEFGDAKRRFFCIECGKTIEADQKLPGRSDHHRTFGSNEEDEG